MSDRTTHSRDDLVMWHSVSMEGLLRSQLKTVAPTHVAVKRLDGAYEAFDRAAAGFVAA